MAEVLNSFDTWLYISKLTNKTESFSITGITNITIDNTGNKKVLPQMELSGIATINSITNSEEVIQFDTAIALELNDKLTLDFKSQIYEFYDNSLATTTDLISDIIITDLITVKENVENTYTFDVVGDCDIDITYETYYQEEKMHYVEQFKINKSLGYKSKKPFNSNKVINRKLDDVKYSFNISKMQVGNLNEEDEFCLKWYKYNDQTYNESMEYLVGVRFDRLDDGYSNVNEVIQDVISGTAINILKQQ